jgi:hypothetical protein
MQVVRKGLQFARLSLRPDAASTRRAQRSVGQCSGGLRDVDYPHYPDAQQLHSTRSIAQLPSRHEDPVRSRSRDIPRESHGPNPVCQAGNEPYPDFPKVYVPKETDVMTAFLLDYVHHRDEVADKTERSTVAPLVSWRLVSWRLSSCLFHPALARRCFAKLAKTDRRRGTCSGSRWCRGNREATAARSRLGCVVRPRLWGTSNPRVQESHGVLLFSARISHTVLFTRSLSLEIESNCISTY